jgi:hypothetical protein
LVRHLDLGTKHQFEWLDKHVATRGFTASTFYAFHKDERWPRSESKCHNTMAEKKRGKKGEGGSDAPHVPRGVRIYQQGEFVGDEVEGRRVRDRELSTVHQRALGHHPHRRVELRGRRPEESL